MRVVQDKNSRKQYNPYSRFVCAVARDQTLLDLVGHTYEPWLNLISWLARRRVGKCPGCHEDFVDVPHKHWLFGFECHRQCFEVKQERTAQHNAVPRSWHCTRDPAMDILDKFTNHPKEYLPVLYYIPQTSSKSMHEKIRSSATKSKLIDFYVFASRVVRPAERRGDLKYISVKAVMKECSRNQAEHEMRLADILATDDPSYSPGEIAYKTAVSSLLRAAEYIDKHIVDRIVRDAGGASSSVCATKRRRLC